MTKIIWLICMPMNLIFKLLGSSLRSYVYTVGKFNSDFTKWYIELLGSYLCQSVGRNSPRFLKLGYVCHIVLKRLNKIIIQVTTIESHINCNLLAYREKSTVLCWIVADNFFVFRTI